MLLWWEHLSSRQMTSVKNKVIGKIEKDVEYINEAKFETYKQMLDYISYKRNNREGYVWALFEFNLIDSDEFHELGDIMRKEFSYERFEHKFG